MRKVNLKTYLIVAFCVIVFGGFTQAQIQSVEPNEAAKTERHKRELARQANRLRLQKRAEMKKWRKLWKKWEELETGITKEQVLKTLGKPKLIQGGSDRYILFYQDLPTSKKDIGVYGWPGTVIFEAKSLDTLIDEEIERYEEGIAEAKLNLKENVEKWNDKYSDAIEQAKAEYDQTEHRIREDEAKEDIRYYRRYRSQWRWKKRRKAAAKNRLKKLRVAAEVDETVTKHEETRERVTRREQDMFETAVKRAKNNHLKRLKRLESKPRSPEFILESLKQPDWDKFEALLLNEKPRERKEHLTKKWKDPRRWRKLKINMTVKQVHAILGEPERSETDMEDTREYYGDVSRHGELYFTAPSDLEEHLDSWIEPLWPEVQRQPLPPLLADTITVEHHQIQEATDWQRVHNADTILDYENFLRRYPQSKFAKKAQKRLEELREESTYWEKALKINTIAGYEDFLKVHPNNPYVSRAEAKIVDLEVADIMRAPHGNLPSMQKVSGTETRSYSIINIHNDTSYNLTIRYSGHDSFKVVFSPGEKSSVEALNGQYKVAASVNAAHVSNYAGQENLDDGNYEVAYYTVTTGSYGTTPPRVSLPKFYSGSAPKFIPWPTKRKLPLRK